MKDSKFIREKKRKLTEIMKKVRGAEKEKRKVTRP